MVWQLESLGWHYSSVNQVQWLSPVILVQLIQESFVQYALVELLAIWFSL